MRFQDRVALVTGAGRGIGHAIAMRLAREGARVACVSRTEANAQKTAGEIGERARAYVIDVGDHAAVQKIAEQILSDFDRVDILVNNAGVTRDTLAMRMSEQDWDVVLNTNLKGAFNFTQALLRSMVRQRSGRIINISSVVGIIGNAGQANYVASKAGLIGLTKSIAREVASRGITVNAIAPGLIETDMTTVLSDDIRKNILSKIPLGSLGQPEDIASAVAFLASDEARYITGQVLCVDGGMVM